MPTFVGQGPSDFYPYEAMSDRVASTSQLYIYLAV